MPHLKPLRPRNGPILDYIANLAPDDQTEIKHRIRALLTEGDGVMLMELLENSVDARLVDIREDPRASEYAMVWRFLVSDLKLIARTENAYHAPLATGRPQRSR